MTIYIWLLACTYKTTSPSIPSSNNQIEDTNGIVNDTGIVDSGNSNNSAASDTADTNDSTDSDSNGVMVNDFNLPDINPQSATFGQDYSPRDYLQKVSGWYFIKST